LRCKLKIDFFYVEIDMSCLKCGDFNDNSSNAVIRAIKNNHFRCFKKLLKIYSKSCVGYGLYLYIMESASLKFKKYIFSCKRFSYFEMMYLLQGISSFRHIKKIIREYGLWKIYNYCFRMIKKIYWESIIKGPTENTQKYRHKYIDLLSFSRSWIFEM
jgi:hypothetical protein